MTVGGGFSSGSGNGANVVQGCTGAAAICGEITALIGVQQPFVATDISVADPANLSWTVDFVQATVLGDGQNTSYFTATLD